MDHRIETLPPMRFACVHGVGPYHVVLPQSWQKLPALAGPLGLFKPGMLCVSITNDDPKTVPAEQLNSYAGVQVDGSFAGTPELPVKTLAGGRYAIFTYLGPYSGLPQAWDEACAMLEPSKLKVRGGDFFEAYLNQPDQVPPEQLRTDMYMPIE